MNNCLRQVAATSPASVRRVFVCALSDTVMRCRVRSFHRAGDEDYARRRYFRRRIRRQFPVWIKAAFRHHL